MKSFRKELWFDVPTRRAFLNITPEVEVALGESGIREGLCLVKAGRSCTAINVCRLTEIEREAPGGTRCD